ncbi:uncharacterized protein LOC129577764 [Sitodiplosis mosellana]|uniref:uncharacterized protein LOC129577764 n=1 Tax=Sitodiplosis mosellana TaxID=263140 RepID=UPI002443EE3D|nr:uncharacterized protein LOC129577764 [Sitodiplosis mosellana]
MNVVNFLKANSLDLLKSEYSLRVKEYPEQNYKVISRAYDRFFNYNECDGALHNNDECYAIEKIDGSLIKIYHLNGAWHVSTRGTAFAECTVTDTKTTYKQAVFEALSLINAGDVINVKAEHKFQQFCRNCDMNIGHTYILELTGKRNRIVTEYNPHKYELWFLGIRRNDLAGKFIDADTMRQLAFLRPKHFKFTNIKECVERAKNPRNLQEGFVVYNQTTAEPVFKVKSPTYVIAHNSANNINDRDICKMITNGELTEFLAYFPQHKPKFDEYTVAMDKYFATAQTEYEELCKIMKSDKDFDVFTTKKWTRLAVLTFKNKDNNNLYATFLNWPEDSQCKF